MKTGQKIRIFLAVILTITITGACGVQEEAENNTLDTGFQAATAGSYDSEDTAVVIKTDTQNNTITLLNLELGKQYTLNYDGTTSIYDKYDVAIVMTQIRTGDIVDVRFMHSRKRLTYMKISASAWYYDSATKFTIDQDTGSLIIGTDTYQINDKVVVVSDTDLITLSDIQDKDVITIAGIDRTVYSIIVEKGHGYVSLVNDDNFIGGWLEIGTSIVPIREGMLLTIPEGSYDALVSYSGTTATLPITVERNEESELDLGSIEMVETGYGMVIFSISPASATVYIDSIETDVTDPVYLTCGIHQIILNATGYTSTTQYIKVGSVTSTLDFTLESLGDSTDTSTDSTSTDSTTDSTATDSTDTTSTDTTNTTTDTTVTATTTQSGTGYQVYIDSPESVEVYVDGTYIGMSPLNFDKKAGDYIITLRKTGYQTRSYSVTVDSEEKDSILTFADLTVL